MNTDPIKREVVILEARLSRAAKDSEFLLSAIRTCLKELGMLNERIPQEDGMASAPDVSDPFGPNLQMDFD